MIGKIKFQEKLILCISILTILAGHFADKYNLDGLVLWISLIPILFVFFSDRSCAVHLIFFFIGCGNVLEILGISLPTVISFVCILKELCFYKTRWPMRSTALGFIMIAYVFQYLLLYRDISACLIIIKLLILLLWIWIYLTPEVIHNPISIVNYMIAGIIYSFLGAILINPFFFRGLRWAMSEDTGINATGLMAAITFTVCMVCLWNSGLKKRVYLFASLVTGIMVIMTGSRMAILIVFGTSIWLLGYSFFSRKVKTKLLGINILFLLLITLIISVISSDQIQVTISYILRKLMEPKSGDISNGRFDIWVEYLQKWMENPQWILFGAGSYQTLGCTVMAHNMVIEQLVQFGIIGNLLLLLLYFKVWDHIKIKFKVSSSLNEFSYVPLIIIIMIFLSGITGHIFISVNYTLWFFLGELLSYTYKEIGVKNEKCK